MQFNICFNTQLWAPTSLGSSFKSQKVKPKQCPNTAFRRLYPSGQESGYFPSFKRQNQIIIVIIIVVIIIGFTPNLMNWDEVFWQIRKQPYKTAFTDERCYGCNSQVLTMKKQGMRTQKQHKYITTQTWNSLHQRSWCIDTIFRLDREIMNQICLRKRAYPVEIYYRRVISLDLRNICSQLSNLLTGFTHSVKSYTPSSRIWEMLISWNSIRWCMHFSRLKWI